MLVVAVHTARHFYRLKSSINQGFVAVVVQVVNSEVSGVVTVHPVTKDRNQMIVEAWAGGALVSGRITPDTYVIDKRDFSLLARSWVSRTSRLRDPKGRNKIVKLTPKSAFETSSLPRKSSNRQNRAL